MPIRPLLLLALSFCLFKGLFGQPASVHFSRVDINNGLSNNQVNAIFRDKTGFVWIGTMNGLNRYDGSGCKIFRSQPNDTNSLRDNYIQWIYPFPGDKMLLNTRQGLHIYDPLTERFSQNVPKQLAQIGLPDTLLEKVLLDRQGNFWFVFPGKGLYQTTANGKTLQYGHKNAQFAVLGSSLVSDVAEGADGLIWVVYRDGTLEKLDPNNNRVVARYPSLVNLPKGNTGLFNLFVGSNGVAWITQRNSADGIYRFNPIDRSLIRLRKESFVNPLRSNIITGVTEDNQGNIWIATDHGGLQIIHAKTGSIRYLENNTEDNRSLSQNSLVSMYRDNEGIIWVGTYKQGLNYYNENVPAFPLYKHLANNPASLPFEDVNRFVEDEQGNIWIGTNGGGLLYFNRSTQSFKQYLAGPGSISNNVIVSLFIDNEKKLWIGSFFGGLDCYDGTRFINYRNIPDQPNSLSENQVWEIYEDPKKQLWVGTLNGGLNLFDRQTKTFTQFKAGGPGTLASDYISALTSDATGNLWVGTLSGIAMRDADGLFVRIQNQPADTSSLSNNNVISLLNDSRGYMWVGTRDGLNLYNPKTKKFRRFFKEQGLADNTILNILEDEFGHIWISTTNGLSRIQLLNTEKGIANIGIKVRSFNEQNNLQGREFNENAAFRTSKGELIFGGPFGFNLFKPIQNDSISGKAGIVFTSFELFNKTIGVGEEINGKIILPEAISRVSSITLPFNQNVISIAFTTLSFPHSGKEHYAYQLEGFNKNWLYTDAQTRNLTFTNLDAGSYLLRVKGLNHLGEFSGSEAKLKITILPPFWRTTWAYLLYVLLIVAALWLARRQILQRAKMRFALEQERTEARRMHELDVMKIRFITNVSHEFRTPLSLILSPAEKGLKQATDPGQQKQYQLIYRNARRLLNLVNQLLDFRKLEVQEFSLNMQRANIVAFIKEIASSFLDLAEHKHIQFVFTAEIPALDFDFDADKMEKILFNLLSNAYKFTPDGGKVALTLKVKDSHLGSLEMQQVLEISIKDSGIGIPPEKQSRIFDRFFQHELPGNFLNQGSGIGLAIVKEFVSLQKGQIFVESKVDEGTCFTLSFPLTQNFETIDSAPFTLNGSHQQKELTSALPGLKGKRARILIVEDNEDFRFYLKENLGLHFHVAEAANGKLGWQQVQQWEPDLVVSDIMMPVMNGLELAKKIKADPRTNTIPIILLTAQTAEEQQLEGLQTGANDYISKPFSFEILISRIRNLLRQQKVLKKPVQKITISTTDIKPESPEEKFLLQALEEVEKNMANPDFSVEDLSRTMLLSRVGLYKKMVAQTGKTPIEFIRDIRMERAKQMLEKTGRNIAEIAYEVGYNDPKYFAKTFKKCFGVLPSAYTAQKNDTGPDNLPEESE